MLTAPPDTHQKITIRNIIKYDILSANETYSGQYKSET